MPTVHKKCEGCFCNIWFNNNNDKTAFTEIYSLRYSHSETGWPPVYM